jgi:hypothetical protein
MLIDRDRDSVGRAKHRFDLRNPGELGELSLRQYRAGVADPNDQGTALHFDRNKSVFDRHTLGDPLDGAGIDKNMREIHERQRVPFSQRLEEKEPGDILFPDQHFPYELVGPFLLTERFFQLRPIDQLFLDQDLANMPLFHKEYLFYGFMPRAQDED